MNSVKSYYFFIAAFPGYFAYHVLKSTIHTPHIGWFSAVLILCAGTLTAHSLLYSVKRGISIKATPVSIPVHFLIFLMTASVIANHLLNRSSFITLEGSISNVLVIIWLVALYQIGRNFDPPQPKTSLTALMIFFAISTFIFYERSSGSIVMPLLPGDQYAAANYQGISRSVFCTALVLLPFTRGLLYKIFMMLATCILLYFIGSRTELLLFIIASAAFALINLRLHTTSAIALLLFISFASYIIFSGIDILGSLQNYTSSDASLNERSRMFESGIKGIIDNPISGDYLGQVRDFGQPGYYIHNALSIWQQHGVMSFVLYIYLCLLSLYIAIRELAIGNKNPHVECLLYLSITCFIGVISTKAVAWPIPALAWGLAANVLSRKNYNFRPPAQPPLS